MPRTAQVVLVTGASSGFGRLTAESLARAGHVVAAGMREVAGRNAAAAAELEKLAADDVAVHAVELDVQSQESVDAAVATTVDRHGRLDVVVHNVGHMVLGPATRPSSPRTSRRRPGWTPWPRATRAS